MSFSKLAVLVFATASLAAASPYFAPRSPAPSAFDRLLSSSCPTDGTLSCHNTTVVDNTCCFEANGQLLQVQFWDADPPTGPSDSWTIHGLWPDYCVSGYPQNCDPSRAYTNISALLTSQGAADTLSFMNTYWKNQGASDESFWEHEWGKHGTCMTTLDTQCIPADSPPGAEAVAFFQTVVGLYKTLPTYQWLAQAGILPDATKTYTLAELIAPLQAAYGFVPALDCENGAQVYQISYYYNLRGSIIDGTFVPMNAPAPGSCPSTGIQYLPKSNSTTTSTTSVPSSTSTSTTSVPTATSTGFPASAHVTALESNGAVIGGLLSLATWSTQTLATMHFVGNASAFTMSSSKGQCAVSAGALACNSTIPAGAIFTAQAAPDGSLLLVWNGSTQWSSDGTPSGATVFTAYSGADHAVPYQLVMAGPGSVPPPTTTTGTATSSTPAPSSSMSSTITTSSSTSSSSSLTSSTSPLSSSTLSTTTTTTTTASSSASSTTSIAPTSTSSGPISTTVTPTSTASSTATSSSPSASPTSSALAAGWSTALACAIDVPTRALASPEYYQLADNSPLACTSLCGARGFALASVEYGDECFCANEYTLGITPLSVPASQCHMPCSGDASATCGGGFLMQVYASTQAGNGVATLPAGWAATIPCAVDTVDRVFANAVSTTLLDNTPQRCINHCAALNLTLAGVEYGDECYCGSAYRGGALPATAPASQCTFACAGAPTLTCGGSWGIQLYAQS